MIQPYSLFIIVILLLVDFSKELSFNLWSVSLSISFLIHLFLYFLLNSCLIIQNNFLIKKNRVSKKRLYLVAHLEICLFFILSFFTLNLKNLFLIESVYIICHLYVLILYFFSLFIFHLSHYKFKQDSFPFQSTKRELFLLVPNFIPFVLFTLLSDLLSLDYVMHFYADLVFQFPPYLAEFMFLSLLLIFMISMVILLPLLAIWLWDCQPIENLVLKQELEALCKKVKFRHRGLLDWPVLNRSLTAAIMGVIPSVRYILFTRALQQTLSTEAIKAVLAHEIGHSQRRHLLLYPLILSGLPLFLMMVSTYLLPIFLYLLDLFIYFLPSYFLLIEHPHLIALFFTFILYSFIIWFYFQIIVNFFSRLFERQADLYGLHLGLTLDSMSAALATIGSYTGSSLMPDRQHHSIQQRLSFLAAVNKNPQLISHHDKRVKRWLLIYAVAWFIAAGTLFAF